MTQGNENIKMTGKFFLLVLGISFFPLLIFSQSDSTYADSAELDEQTVEEVNYFLANDEAADETEIQLRRLPDSALNAYKKDKAFWYADGNWDKPKENRDDPNIKFSEPFYRKAWFRSLLWVIIIGSFIAVVIWYLSLNDATIFRRRKVLLGAEEETESENIFEINFPREINKAAGTGNYRLAVRLMFLQLLKNLSEKEIIQYKQDRTNFDYLLQLQQTGYYKDFFRLTRSYEHAWYGQFDLSGENYSLVKKDFDNFHQRIQ